MSQNTVKKVHLIYGIVLSVLILAVGVCLVLSCLDIYHSGERPFSRASIAEAFLRIDLLVYVTLICALGGAVLSVVLPLNATRPRAMREEYDTLVRLRETVGASVPNGEKHLRVVLRCGTALLSLLLFVYPAAYFLDVSRFGLKDINASVISALIPTGIASAIVLVLLALSAYLCRRSVKREIAACKAALAEGKRGAPSCDGRLARFKAKLSMHEKPIVLSVRLMILVVAAVFLVLGVLNGGIDDVLGKAIRICTECIGLG